MTPAHAWLYGSVFVPEKTIGGTRHDDTLIGTSGDDKIDGNKGADLMQGGLGFDTYIVDNTGDRIVEEAGGGDYDKVMASVSYTLSDYVEWLTLTGKADLSGTGSAQDNDITGNVGNNLLSGGDGNDSLMGMAGADTLDGGNGNDDLSGGDGNDLLRVGQQGGGTLNGDAGNDTLVGGDTYGLWHMILQGGDGNDVLTAGAADALMYGGNGNDTITGGVGRDRLVGEDGNDVANGGSGDDTFYERDSDGDTYDGGDGHDVFSVDWSQELVAVHWVMTTDDSTVYGNVITGFERLSGYLTKGDDFADARLLSGTGLNGAAGNDQLIGGSSAETDYLEGGDGNDTLQGLGGYDILDGDDGSDVVDAGAGDDYVYDNWDEGAADTLIGGDGIDTLNVDWDLYDRPSPSVTWVFSQGQHNANGNTISGFEDLVVSLGDGNDYVDASAASMLRIHSGVGDDTLIGSSGVNTFRGEDGSDHLSGGSGKDFFELSSRIGSDTIDNFSRGVDRIDLKVRLLPVGDKDTHIDGATVIGGPGGFSTAAELVIVTADIDGAITAAGAAAAIGSASSAYANKTTVLFAVDNGVDSAIFHFQAQGADAIVSAGELALLATLTDVDSTSVGDYNFKGHW